MLHKHLQMHLCACIRSDRSDAQASIFPENKGFGVHKMFPASLPSDEENGARTEGVHDTAASSGGGLL